MPGESKQTSSSSSEPWKAVQPALKQGLTDASDLYTQGNFSPVTPFSDNTQKGMSEISRVSLANAGGSGLSGRLQGVINSGGYNPAQLAALKNTQDVANSTFNINDDPGFKQVIDQATNSVNGNASAAGRYGSGTNQQLLGNTIGDLGARQYQAWQSRRDAANSNLFNMGQTGFGNLGTAYQSLKAPATDLMGVGSMQEDLLRRQAGAKADNFAKYYGLLTGTAGLGGTSTQTQPGQNPFLSTLGYGLTGLGALGGF